MRVHVATPARGSARSRARRLRAAIAALLLLAAAAGGAAFAGATVQTLNQRTVTAWQTAESWLGLGGRSPLPILAIDIKFTHLQDLRNRHAVWLARGARHAQDKDAVSAAVRLGNARREIGVSLAGSADDAGPGQLGRLRITVRGDGSVLGMKRFVLDDPHRPGFSQEVLFYAALERAGLIAPRLRAVAVEVNGTDWGQAVAVEQPSPDHVEAHGRPPGPLVGWDSPVVPGEDADAVTWLDPRPLEPKVEGEVRRIAGTPMADQAALAVSLLRDLMRGKLPAERVVDVDRTARYLALCEVWGMADGLQWGAARWLLHPLTLRLEPFVRLTPSSGRVVDGLVMAQYLLQSPVLRARYEVALREEADRVLAPAEAARLVARVHERLPSLDAAELSSRPTVARARQVLDAQSLHLVPLPPGASQPVPLAEMQNPLEALPFAHTDAAAMTVTVPAGTWDVPRTVQLPEGMRLTLQAGAVLRFGPGAWLVVRGGCDVLGRADAPVVLQAATDQPWGGVEVVQAHGSRWSHVQVRDAGGQGSGAWRPQAAIVWVDSEITMDHAAISAPGGDIAAVRAMGGSVRLSDSTWTGSAQSGLELSYCRSTLTNLRFENVGADALDVVGGSANIAGIFVRDSGGAALRAGSGAEVDLRTLDGDRVANGLVARDGSLLRVSASRIGGVRHLGYLAYNQTPGQDPARLQARHVQIFGARQQHLCTGGASVDIDGHEQDCSAVSVQQLVAAGIARR